MVSERLEYATDNAVASGVYLDSGLVSVGLGGVADVAVFAVTDSTSCFVFLSDNLYSFYFQVIFYCSILHGEKEEN